MSNQLSIYESPYSEETKKVKRNVLLISSFCLLVSVTEELPSSFALFGAKFDTAQQITLGWFLFGVALYTYLHFLGLAGVEIAKWLQPFLETVESRRLLLRHPAFDESYWYDTFGPVDEQNLDQVAEEAAREARYKVVRRLRYLYRLVYLRLILEVLVPLVVGGAGLFFLAKFVIEVGK